MRFIPILFIAMLALQCAPKQKTAVAATKLTEEAIWLGMQRLVGEWYDPTQKVYEEWEVNGQYNLKGEGYDKDVAGNHITTERLKLMWAPGKAITYEATVMRDNEGHATRFPLTQADKMSYTFENPEHDFPKKIRYVITGPETMEATISGGNKSLTYKFARVIAETNE